MMKEPLVSIVVVSYNSNEFIIDALESVKDQKYKNLELIVSDDGSTDSTIEKVKTWLTSNMERFVNVKVIKSNINTGITLNLNRGVKVVNGQYLKLMAADDILLDNCISDLLNYVLEKDLPFCFSRALPFCDNNESNYVKEIIETDKKNYDFFFSKSHKEQYHALLRLTIPLSIIIGGFYSKSTLDKIDYYDEKYEMMEDYPFMINLADFGYKFVLLDEYTTKYRVRNKLDQENIDNFKKSKRFLAHYKNLMDYREKEIIPRMKKEKMYFSVIYLKMVMILLKIEFNGNGKFVRFMYTKLRKCKKILMRVNV